MTLILELICSWCSKKDCKNHQQKTTVQDKITGLAFEVRCVCNNHGDESE